MTVDTQTVAITRRASGKTVTYRVPIDAALSRPEAAALLRLSLRHIYRLIKAARLPIVHERGDVHIPIAFRVMRTSRARSKARSGRLAGISRTIAVDAADRA